MIRNYDLRPVVEALVTKEWVRRRQERKLRQDLRAAHRQRAKERQEADVVRSMCDGVSLFPLPPISL
jgi:hypothetical protein